MLAHQSKKKIKIKRQIDGSNLENFPNLITSQDTTVVTVKLVIISNNKTLSPHPTALNFPHCVKSGKRRQRHDYAPQCRLRRGCPCGMRRCSHWISVISVNSVSTPLSACSLIRLGSSFNIQRCKCIILFIFQKMFFFFFWCTLYGSNICAA